MCEGLHMDPQTTSQGVIKPGFKRFYRGWHVVLIAGIFHALLGGLFHTGLSIYFLPLTRTFEVSRTKLSLAFSIRSLEGGIEGPLAGYLVDRFGPRWFVVAGALLSGAGFILMALAHSYITFLLVFLCILAIGISLPFHGLIVAINFWFRRRLGTAMSLASTGSAIGGFTLTPIVAWIVLNHGWRPAAAISGVLFLVIGLPLALLVRKPTDNEALIEEWPSDRTRPSLTYSHTHETAADASVSRDFTVRAALHTRTYWLLALAIGLRLTAQSAITVHLVPMLVSRDITEGMAALLVSVQALLRLPVVIGAGLWADRWSRSKAAATAMVIGAAAAAYIAYGPNGLLTGAIFVVLFAGAESCNSVTWALIGDYFGRRSFGSLRGIVTLFQSLMSTLGPLGAGFVYDVTGNYKIAFLVIGGMYLISSILFWTLKTPAAPAGRVDNPDIEPNPTIQEGVSLPRVVLTRRRLTPGEP